MRSILGLYIFFLSPIILSLPPDSISKIDSTNSFELHLGFEWYYSYNSFSTSGSKLPLFVSFGHANELNQNMIYADLKLQKKRLRGHFLPAMGTFMEHNSASEKGIFKNLLEANVGVQLSKKRNIWLDAGVLGSPYSNESPFSMDQLVLTRSLSAEYVPYYLAGARLSGVHKDWLTWHLYLLNGWQQIADINSSKSFGSKIEMQLNPKNKLNVNTYIGKEGISGATTFGMRYFLDLFWVHDFSTKWTFISCGYAGRQQFLNNSGAYWGQLNGAVRYTTDKYGSFSFRAEYYLDSKNVVVAPLVESQGFKCFGYSVGYNYRLLKTMLFRVEYRRLDGQNGMLYSLSDGKTLPSLNLFTTALTFWF